MLARTVLVVEDDDHVRALALRVFQKAGFETFAVETADQAAAFVFERAECTAFLFTDVQTPGSMDGIGLARLVRTHWPHVEIVVTSGYPIEASSIPRGVRFEPKPWRPEELLRLAHAVVGRLTAAETEMLAESEGRA